jgi:hypothetical protein
LSRSPFREVILPSSINYISDAISKTAQPMP